MVFEVPTPILNGPYDEPQWHGRLMEGEPPEKRPGRRPAMHWFEPPTRREEQDEKGTCERPGTRIEPKLTNLTREHEKT
ncbi:MAG: hypothetical protein HRF50_07325 [Phycisphaerae bacterium]